MRVFIVGCLLLVIHSVQAETYYWKFNNNANFIRPTAIEVCDLLYKPSQGFIDNGSEFISETRYRCSKKQLEGNGVTWYNVSSDKIFRFGDSCPSGSSYNPETGGCDEASLSCPEAKPVASTLNLSMGCHVGCRYENLGGFRDYNNLLSEVTYDYVATGEECLAGDQDITDAENYSETNEEGQDCRTSNEIQFCVDDDRTCRFINDQEICINHETREERYNCGTFNGEVVCIEKNEQSNCRFVNGEHLCLYPEGDKVDENSVDHPDNGGNANRNIQDDILDQEDLDQNTPQAQHTQTIIRETIIKQAAQKQAENDNPSSAVSGIECDKAMNCTGDAVQCVIARYEKQQACLFELQTTELHQQIDANPATKPLGSYESDTTLIDLEGMISEDGRFVESASCPEPMSFAVYGKDFAISFDPMCDLAGYIRYFILFATWFSVAVLIAKSF